MKFNGLNCARSIACILFVSSGSVVYAGTMGDESVAPMGAVYIGGFGGGAYITNGNLSQQGTALYVPGSSLGSPLAVNAKGTAKSSSAWVAGGHVGYRWSEHLSNYFGSNWMFAPAAELEGYYLGGSTLIGDDLNNSSTKITEHDFHVTYPMHTGVFLVNAVLNVNYSNLGKIHPYIGIGAGTAVVSITGANSLQISPLELGINHYNSGPNDTALAFAAQPKIGVSFNVAKNIDMFVEYRFLYLSPTDYAFGSTVYPTHVATTNWDVVVGTQYYNMGSVGVQFDL